jgi:hypothetical protein
MIRNVRHSIAYSLRAILVWRFTFRLYGTEFSGGRVTGPLLEMADIGIILFVLAVILAFVTLRFSATAALIASVITLPLYSYFAFPGLFRQVIKGEYSAPAPEWFVWGPSVIGFVTLLLAAAYSLRTMLLSRHLPNDSPE